MSCKKQGELTFHDHAKLVSNCKCSCTRHSSSKSLSHVFSNPPVVTCNVSMSSQGFYVDAAGWMIHWSWLDGITIFVTHGAITLLHWLTSSIRTPLNTVDHDASCMFAMLLWSSFHRYLNTCSGLSAWLNTQWHNGYDDIVIIYFVWVWWYVSYVFLCNVLVQDNNRCVDWLSDIFWRITTVLRGAVLPTMTTRTIELPLTLSLSLSNLYIYMATHVYIYIYPQGSFRQLHNCSETKCSLCLITSYYAQNVCMCCMWMCST